ncbi:MAG: peptide ABC transporter substrate-binding protein [Candidatus Eiseniibacteriota bacterium]
MDHAPNLRGRAAALGLALLALSAPGLLSCARRSAPAEHGTHAASYFGSLKPPHGNVLRFSNGPEPETYDPGIAVGQPDGRVARILFEGLTVPNAQTLAPEPGQAYRWDLSADGRTYIFHLRPGLEWSDGTPLTAHDFVWSWLRVLKPENAGRYASALYPIDGAESFSKGEITDSTRVGIEARDDSTLVVRLHDPTAYFLFMTAFYTYVPVPRHVIERYGDQWTRPGKIVSNGCWTLESWRQQDRFVFVRNPRYWDAGAVKLDRIEAYSVEDLNTVTNLYKAGVIDWTTSGYIPSPFLPYMFQYADFQHARFQGVYFYSINVTRKPFDNVWFRRALNWSIDREAIARDLLKGTRDPWGNFTPAGYPGYHAPRPIGFDPAKAREYLARAGFPGGRGCPKVSILINTSEDHRRIAEALQQMWKRELNIPVEISNQEWGSFMQATTLKQYDVARRSWIGDYLDPTTFLGVMFTDDGNNRTGWSNARYDGLLRDAAREVNPEKRLAMLSEAEAVLLDESPVIPIYHYTINSMVKPYVHGIYPTALDTNPLKRVWIDHDWKPGAPTLAGRP